MRWVYLLGTVVSGTIGDVLSAKAMAMGGEINDFSPRGIARIVRYVLTHRLLIIGIVCNAISFFTFIALLTVSQLSFAVPATALAYILKTVLARVYLGECVTWRRWAGAILVGVGVMLLVS
jgi:drug/metabolite transporter (DMT)-like permease